MTKILPYLILPLGVALLEYHGIQFWTVAVTGAWPGWFTAGFALAWHAWGWPLLLEAGALWCWLQSRGEGWRGGIWTFGGGVLTIVLCTAALWNVAAPMRQNLAVSALMESERDRVGAQEQAAQGILMHSDKPYRRLVDILERSSARAADLFSESLAAAKDGTAVTGGEGRIVLWLQIACVGLGQLLVVASARAMGEQTEEGEEDLEDESLYRAGHSMVWAWLSRVRRQSQRLVAFVASRAFVTPPAPAGAAGPKGPATGSLVPSPPGHGDPPSADDAGAGGLQVGRYGLIDGLLKRWKGTDWDTDWGANIELPREDNHDTNSSAAVGGGTEGLGDAAGERSETGKGEGTASRGVTSDLRESGGSIGLESQSGSGSGNQALPRAETAKRQEGNAETASGTTPETRTETAGNPEKPLPVARVGAAWAQLRAAYPGVDTYQGLADVLGGAAGGFTKKMIWQLGTHSARIAKGEPTIGAGQLQRVETALAALETSSQGRVIA